MPGANPAPSMGLAVALTSSLPRWLGRNRRSKSGAPDPGDCQRTGHGQGGTTRSRGSAGFESLFSLADCCCRQSTGSDSAGAVVMPLKCVAHRIGEEQEQSTLSAPHQAGVTRSDNQVAIDVNTDIPVELYFDLMKAAASAKGRGQHRLQEVRSSAMPASSEKKYHLVRYSPAVSTAPTQVVERPAPTVQGRAEQSGAGSWKEVEAVGTAPVAAAPAGRGGG